MSSVLVSQAAAAAGSSLALQFLDLVRDQLGKTLFVHAWRRVDIDGGRNDLPCPSRGWRCRSNWWSVIDRYRGRAGDRTGRTEGNASTGGGQLLRHRHDRTERATLTSFNTLRQAGHGETAEAGEHS